MSDLSYHDVRVTVDGVEYRIANDYTLELTCTRVGGWRLWRRNEMIGGEYEGGNFAIHVRRWWGWARIV